jgi:lipopolysaccharide export system permease protein
MILFWYLFRRFLGVFGRVLGIFTAIMFIIGIVDELGRLEQGEGILRAAYLSALGQIEGLYMIIPLLVIIAAITMFMGMAKTSEIVAVRAAGRSGLQFLYAPALAALCIGGACLALLNPVTTAMMAQYNFEKGRPAVSRIMYEETSGLWLRQSGQDGQVIINAAASEPGNLVLTSVDFIGFDANGTPSWRIQSPRAALGQNNWVLEGGYRWDLTAPNPQFARKALPIGALLATDLVPDDMQAGFGKPSNVPIWSLPAQIAMLDKAGFSSRAYRVWLHSELAKPFTFVVMVLVAAGFTMRHIRDGHRAKMVLYAMLAGFGLFFLRNIAQVFGQNGQVPALLAAWGPTFAASLLAISLLLHLEEG